MSADIQSRRKKELVAYVLAAILMIVRVDFWWWEAEMPMILFGWINAPMLYQFGIWTAGFILVVYVANYFWTD